MRINIIAGCEIDAELQRLWTGIQRSNSELASAYFAPEFTMAMASVRNDVEVAIVEDEREIVAIFPFQRSDSSLGIPVAGVLSDYQGLVCRPGFVCDPREMVKGCRLAAWDFDHLLVSQACFAPFHQTVRESSLMDLSQGYEAYVTERRAAGSEQIKKCGNLTRRIEREIGSLRFVDHAEDPALLQRVLAWKSQQFHESGKWDMFAEPWVRSAVERIHGTRSSGCAGMLSLLYAGDRLVAGHMGMRSRTAWHYWFPAYDKEFAKYSPGLLLLLKMAERAPSLGLRVIDLGMGLSLYKERLMNSSLPVASGSVELPSWLSFRRAARRKLRGLAETIRIAGPARRLVNRFDVSHQYASPNR